MTFTILLAGGSGQRMGGSVSKVLLPVSGTAALIRCMHAFTQLCDGFVIVTRQEDRHTINHLMHMNGYHGILFADAGHDRQASVKNGLSMLPAECDIVLVHDGARPLVGRETILRVLNSARINGACAAAIPITDSLRETDENGENSRTLDRSRIWAMQTPQGFHKTLLLEAHTHAEQLNIRGTDEAELVSLLGKRICLVQGARDNLKLTTPEDLAMANGLLAAQEPPPDRMRIGHGYDAHRLVPNRRLILCGLTIPHNAGLSGHSDADTALHALIDAMLGAAGLGDIGHFFPDNDMRYRDISSILLLERVHTLIAEKGWRLINADITIVAQQPRLSVYVPAMRQNIAHALRTAESCINIKATTTEGMGFEGEMEGISATAVCLLAHYNGGI